MLHSPAHRRSSSGLQPSPQGSAACREMSTPIPVPHNLVQQEQQQQQQQQYHHLQLQHEPNTFNAASFSMARAPMILQSYDEPCSNRRRSSDDSNARRLQTTTAAKHSRSCLDRRISCKAYLPLSGHSNQQRSVLSTTYIVANFSSGDNRTDSNVVITKRSLPLHADPLTPQSKRTSPHEGH